jgi:protein-S-isoprenylcysteine O-methyltransferase Ste14
MRKLTLQPVRFVQYFVIVLSFLAGGSSLILFMIFLYEGSFGWVDFGLDKQGLLIFDACLCCLFFIQHSAMIRKSFRSRLSKIIPEYYHMAVYAISSGVVLLILVIFWQNSNLYIFNLHGAFRILFRIIFFSCIGLFVWGIRALGLIDFLGTGSILANIKGIKKEPMPFFVAGPYRWVRHPLYLFTLLMIWFCPDVSIDRLLFNTLVTGWILGAIWLEERDLVDAFGENYQDYQQKVPPLFPRSFVPRV